MANQLLVAPDGTLSSVPENQVADALNPQKGGFTRPPTPSAGSVLAVSPKGVLTVLNKNEATDALDPNKGGFRTFEAAQKTHTEYEGKVDEKLKEIEALWKPPKENENLLDRWKTYDKADLRDEKGQWKMQYTDQNGALQKILVPNDKLFDFYKMGAQFQDPNYQTLIDAYDRRIQPGATDYINKALSTMMFNIPEYLTKSEANDPENNNIRRASQLAMERKKITDSDMRDAEKYGMLLGLVGSLATGGAGEIALGGKVAKAVTTKLGGGALATIAGEAAGGVTMASPQALAQAAIDKDLKGAAETLALGGVIGTAFGGAKVGGKAALEKLSQTGSLADRLLLEQAGTTAAERKVIGDKNSLVNTLVDAGVFQNAEGKTASKAEVIANIKNLVTNEGPNIGKLNNAAEGVFKDNAGLGFNFRKLAVGFEKLAEEQAGPLNKDLQKTYKTAAEQLMEMGGTAETMGPKQAQEAKQLFQGEANYRTTDSSNLNNVRKEIASAVREEQMAALERLAEKSGNPQLVDDFVKSKNLYAAGKTLENAVSRFENAPNTQSILSMIPSISGHHVGPFTAAGAFIGHGAGPAGSAVGAFAGAKVDKLLKAWAKDKGLTKLALWLRKNSDNPAIASFIAMDAVGVAKSRLAEIPSMLEAGAIKATINHDAIKDLLGDRANGLSKDQQFKMLSSVLSQHVANPEGTKSALQEVTAPLRDSHPALADAVEENVTRKMEYLYNILPKNPNQPQPFTKTPDWKPTKAQMDDFNSQAAIANEPLLLIENMKNGTITPKQVAVAAQVNPAILASMRAELARMAYSGKVDMSYKQKLGLSILMGENIVTELNKIPQLQSVYAPAQQQQPQPTQGGSQILPEDLPNQPTTAQRLAAK